MNPLEEDDDESEFDLEDPTPEEPSVDAEIDAPETPSPPGLDTEQDLEANIGEVDDDTLSAFVTCAFLTNVALFGVSLGVMLVYFRGSWRWGGGAVVVGTLAGIRAYQQYRDWRRSREERSDDEPDLSQR